VRNCYHSNRDPIVVENMREYLPRKRAAKYTHFSSVSMRRLEAIGFSVFRGPFLAEQPVPNFIFEATPKEFEEIWAAKQIVPPVNGAEAHEFKPGETPTMRLIELHWKERKLSDGWTVDRVRRICALLHLTPHELAALIQWPHGAMESFLNGGGWRLPGPVVVWLYFLENLRTGIDVFPQFPASQGKIS
jgi:hypothetical protein